jgi:hypothetical protein
MSRYVYRDRFGKRIINRGMYIYDGPEVWNVEGGQVEGMLWWDRHYQSYVFETLVAVRFYSRDGKKIAMTDIRLYVDRVLEDRVTYVLPYIRRKEDEDLEI